MNRKQKTIITDPSFDYLGEQIVKSNPDIIKGDLKFQDFPDGLPDIFLHRVEELIEHKEVTYLCDFSDPKLFLRQYDVMNAILENCADKLRIVMPFFPGQKDRIDTRGETVTAKNLATLLSSLPSGRNGKNSLHIFDIHALQVRGFFDANKINVELHSVMYLIKEKINKNCTIVFPDDGAKKRFAGYFNGYDIIECSKERKGDDRIIRIEGDVKDKDTIIIDDLAQSGNTTLKTTKILRDKGAKSVRAYVSHGVNPNGSHKKMADGLDEYIVTDSIPANHERAKDIENMTVLSIKNLVEEKICENQYYDQAA